jgi:hypothetical protein
MELLYVICQIAAADVCEEHRAMLYGAGPVVCISSAQTELPRLVRPGWTVARWSCQPPVPDRPGEETAVLAAE